MPRCRHRDYPEAQLLRNASHPARRIRQDDVDEHYINNNKSGGLLGVMTAPRKHTKTQVANHYGDTSRTNLDYIIESIELPAAERDKIAK